LLRGNHSVVPDPVGTGAVTEKTTVRSQNLVRIVTTAYGAGITATLAVKSTVFIQPLENWRLSVIVLAVTILMVYGAYSYVMSVSEGPYAYRFTGDDEPKRLRGLLRFFSDLVLAALYVRALLIASTISRATAHQLLFAIAEVFAMVVVVRLLRYGILHSPDWKRNIPSIVTIVAFGVSLGLGFAWRSAIASSTYGAFSVGLLIAVVILYIPLIEVSAKCARDLAPSGKLKGPGKPDPSRNQSTETTPM
jgi:hypothetical protein